MAHSGMSGPDLAAAMTRAGTGSIYDRSTIQKMTVSRKISKAEAEAMAAITGHPVTPLSDMDEALRKYVALSADKKSIVAKLIEVLSQEPHSSTQ